MSRRARHLHYFLVFLTPSLSSSLGMRKPEKHVGTEGSFPVLYPENCAGISLLAFPGVSTDPGPLP